MIWSLLIGYVIGSIPTADAVGRVRGVDLHADGSGNPGTANALRLGGPGMALTVLALDLVKGGAAAVIGRWLAGDAGGVAAAIAAIWGQVASPWHGFKGGKGLGVAGGATLILWPTGLLVVIPVIAVAARVLGSTAGGLMGIATLFVVSIVWATNGWPTAWGVTPDDVLVWFTIWVGVLTAPKFAAALLERFGSRSLRSASRR